MERKELSDIILRNVGGAMKEVERSHPYGMKFNFIEKQLLKLSLLQNKKAWNEHFTRHSGYLDAVKQYFTQPGSPESGDCLTKIREYLVSQYETTDPEVYYQKSNVDAWKRVQKTSYWGQFLLLAIPFTMITPYNLILGGIAFASIFSNRFAKHVSEGAEKMGEGFRQQAKEIEAESRPKREELQSVPVSELEEALNLNKDEIMKYFPQ